MQEGAGRLESGLHPVDMDGDLEARGIDLCDLGEREGHGAGEVVGHGAHVDARLEHDVQVDSQTGLGGGDEHALAQALPGEQADALGALRR